MYNGKMTNWFKMLSVKFQFCAKYNYITMIMSKLIKRY